MWSFYRGEQEMSWATARYLPSEIPNKFRVNYKELSLFVRENVQVLLSPYRAHSESVLMRSVTFLVAPAVKI